MNPHEFPNEHELPAKGAKPESPSGSEPEAPQPGIPFFPDLDLYDAEIYDAFDPDEDEPPPEPNDFCFDEDWDEDDFPFAA